MGLRILYWGDSPTVDTGFGRVAGKVLTGLHERGYEVQALGINEYGNIMEQRRFPFPVWPCDMGSEANVFGFAKFWHIAKQFQPHLFFFLNDPWLIEKLWNFKDGDYPYVKTLAYYPLDGGPMKPEWLKVLNSFDAQVCYSNFAERTIIDSNKGKRPSNLHQIYHGVDTDVFFPVNQQIARAKLEIPNHFFIVGMVARNQFRKRFDIMVKAFSEFAKDKDDARLYLHTALHDVGFDIADLIRQFDIADKIILTEDLTPSKGVEDARLNLIYNSFDINCLISVGDGFGLPVAESMAVGCPQLVSGHSTLQELVEDHGGLTVNNATWIMNTAGFNTWGAISDEKDLVTKLNILYNNKDLRIKLSEDGYKFITQDKFKWPVIVDQFEKIIKDTFHLL